MERIPYPPIENYPPELPKANVLRMLSHSPETMRPMLALGTSCLSSLSLPPRLVQLLTLFCSVKFKSDYIWSRHLEDARKIGVTDAQFDALRSSNTRNPVVWGEKEIAFFRFLDQVTDGPEASDESVNEVKKFFDDKQIVEMIVAQVSRFPLLSMPSDNCQGFYYTWGRVSTTLRVTVDTAVHGGYAKALSWAQNGTS
jgi:alkylhydroperoxidase family enzyme